MTRLEKAMVVLMMFYMLPPIGILAFANPVYSQQSFKSARHQMSSPVIHKSTSYAINARQHKQGGRSPASESSDSPYSCIRHLKR